MCARVGEKVWRMPMEESYWELMKSPIADMKNTGARYGGAITAALFLEKYVDQKKVRSGGLPVACLIETSPGYTNSACSTWYYVFHDDFKL